MFFQHTIAVVIPAFNVENQIPRVLKALPGFVDAIIVIDDCSTDETCAAVNRVPLANLTLIKHRENRGVGGAMKTGFAECLHKGYDIVVKMDGDDQIDSRYLPSLIYPLCMDYCDYAKGNRFSLTPMDATMPLIRRIGNLALSFVNKAATGYWHIFDPQNGFLAIRAKSLKKIRTEWIDNSYYFENSMLVNLNIIEARVADVFIPSRYADEKSHLRISWAIRSFPLRLIRSLCRRSFYRYVYEDFSPIAVLFGFGMISFVFGIVWSCLAWAATIATSRPTPVGTVAIGLVTIILGFQMLLNAVLLDIEGSPSGTHKSFDMSLEECERLVIQAQRQESVDTGHER
jgi:glycosyltransferase involved in cell wall biosynthesis